MISRNSGLFILWSFPRYGLKKMAEEYIYGIVKKLKKQYKLSDLDGSGKVSLDDFSDRADDHRTPLPVHPSRVALIQFIFESSMHH